LNVWATKREEDDFDADEVRTTLGKDWWY